MSGRNDGNSGSPETRRVTEFKDGDKSETESDPKGANQADGKADSDQQAEEESDIEVERQASGE